MSLLLLLAGLLPIAWGLGASAYGVFYPEFRGVDATGATVAVVGGLGLIGLGAVVARLERIAEAVEAQSFSSRAAAPMVEPRAGAATSMGAAAVAAALGEPLDRAPAERLSFPPPPDDAAAEPKLEHVQPPDRPAGASPLAAGSPPTISIDPDLAALPAETAGPAAWPSIEARDRIEPLPSELPISDRKTSPRGEPGARAIEAAPSSANAVVWGLEGLEIGPPSGGKASPGPAVLKSGVIEGMAYTLYSDGSVDAELSQGTRRFASIAEWRSYLRESV